MRRAHVRLMIDITLKAMMISPGMKSHMAGAAEIIWDMTCWECVFFMVFIFITSVVCGQTISPIRSLTRFEAKFDRTLNLKSEGITRQ